MRIPLLISYGAVAIMAAGSFGFSLYVEERRTALKDLGAQIEADRRAIKVLEIELAHLTQPERLQEIVDRHLDMRAPRFGQLFGKPGDLAAVLRLSQGLDPMPGPNEATKPEPAASPLATAPAEGAVDVPQVVKRARLAIAGGDPLKQPVARPVMRPRAAPATRADHLRSIAWRKRARDLVERVANRSAERGGGS
ncbi:MAG: hypothetical protein AAGF15_04260 [Pseudomonadota bacterium]